MWKRYITLGLTALVLFFAEESQNIQSIVHYNLLETKMQ